ncbi:hypothetical protein HS088_TW03G00623 [Tripterygium wilfordii]|uniref:VQ domain-containing protein n=1 Tax=Tripterygium wilfordii TaxID=458696 RepID=A0A7J7DVG7_TRIWF|nr:hypothetical protein HS088_TW03G00623 [Tripterygium wilfordii]
MENILLPNGANKKANTSTTKKKKKPLRVVYISNPKKFNTSATEFRALVQRLTGKDSDPTKFLEDPDFYDVGHQPPALLDGKIDGCDDDDDHQVFSLDPTTSTADESPDPPSLPPLLFAEPFDEYDDAFMPSHHQQMFENNIPLSGFIFSDFSHGDLLRGA